MLPIPQIYYSSQAQQWLRMAQYTKGSKGYKIYFLNTMSSVVACQQRGGCGSVLSQNGSFDALQNLLNADSNVTVNIEGDTDVKWILG